MNRLSAKVRSLIPTKTPMTEKSRFFLAFLAATFMHTSLLVYAEQSATSTSSNSRLQPISFNISPSVQQNTAQDTFAAPPSKVPEVSSKRPAISKEVSPKQRSMRKDVRQKMVASHKPKRSKNKSITPKTTINKNQQQSLTKTVQKSSNRPDQSSTLKPVSVARSFDKVIVRQPRFQTLPTPPNYPRRSRLRGQQGVALIHAQLNITGEVIQIRLVKSSGFSELDKAAVKSVYSWDFMPGSNLLSNTEEWIEIPVAFVLQEQEIG
tara:strand:+ start:723 stop:1517 length:795 start_codon:yes stop_codon:yes gene_type:complete